MTNSSLAEHIRQRASELSEILANHRHHLHKHPELSFKEYQTSSYIAGFLDSLEIPYKSGIAGTGILAEIKGASPGPVIALRADMDALPIVEKNENKSYRSVNEGIMHACGHDVHMTCLMGAITILNEIRNDLKGTLRLIFQPGEEVLPGGASLMIKEGVLEGVDFIIGQHVQPSMNIGNVGFREGMYMASTDELRVTVTGKGGHAAMPAEYVNPVPALSEFILKATYLFMGNQNKAPKDVPTVVAFGKLEAKGATNVIPSIAYAEGTFRTMNEEWRSKAHQLLTQLAEEISIARNVDCKIDISKGYPFLVNDSALTSSAKNYAHEYLGKEHVDELALRMTAEDFAWYTQKIPGCFYRLGTGNSAKGITSGVHTSDFDVDEASLTIGAGLMAYIAARLLSK